MKRALFYEKLPDNRVKCNLCPFHCVIAEEARGFCRVRKNIGGELYSEVYGKVSSMHLDATEKKPLFNFFPGSKLLSVGTVGCNMRCKFCQNWEISQFSIDEFKFLSEASPEDIVKMALELKAKGNIGIAYTYNEPSIWYEYMLDIAKEARKHNLKNVMVTNLYIEEGPLEELMPYIDAFSIDLKGFTQDFYKEMTAANLEPVLRNIKFLKKRGKHIELDFLVIPTKNDSMEDFKKMLLWIRDEVGRDTPLHINRYYPAYKFNEPPTNVKLLLKFYETAKKYLDYVYVGNVGGIDGIENTYCPNCKGESLRRENREVDVKGLNSVGNCVYCKERVMKYASFDVRKNSAEGRFYPDSKSELEKLIGELLAKEKKEIRYKLSEKNIIGGVVPHAGYIFSGYEAVHFFEIAKNQRYDTVVIVNPNHTGMGNSVEVDSHRYWSSPLGNLELDKEMVEALGIPISSVAQSEEHSGEVMIPFLKYFFDYDYKIVPICFLEQNYENAVQLAKKIYQASKKLGRKILIIASSDFSHYVDPELGKNLDDLVIEKILTFDSKELYNKIRNYNISVCGYGPIMTLIEYSKLLKGKAKSEVLRRGNSGEVYPSNEVVDYNSIIFYEEE